MVLHQRVWESNPHTCRIELRLTSTGPTLAPGVHGVLERHVGIEPALAPPTELPSSGLCTFTTMPHKAGLSRLPPIISLCSASWLLTSGSIGNLSSCPRSQMRRVRAWWEWLESNQRFPCCCFTDRTYLPTSLLEPLYRAFKAHGVLPLNYIPIECRSFPAVNRYGFRRLLPIVTIL